MGFREKLMPLFAEESGKPEADPYLMESIYQGLLEAAEAMDCDMIEGIMQEISEYGIPADEKERFARVRKKADMLDYEGIREAIGNI